MVPFDADYSSSEKVSSRTINLGDAKLRQLRRSLIIVADTLCIYGSPDIVRKSADNIAIAPLTGELSSQPFTRSWVTHDSLSCEYSRDEDGELMALRFTSPDEHDVIKVDHLTKGAWNVKEYRSPLLHSRGNIFTDRDLLRILDLKLPDTPTFSHLVSEHAYPRFNPDDLLRPPLSFPEKLIDAVQPMAKKRTELKTFQVISEQTSPGIFIESAGITSPDYSTTVTSEITRAEGTKSVDYSLRVAHSGLEIEVAPFSENNQEVSPVSNIYELGFSVPYDKNRIEKTKTTFSVVGASNMNAKTLKQLARSEGVDTRSAEQFRKCIQMILEKNNILLPMVD